MYSIQDPVLEKLLVFLNGKKEFVFLDTSRPDGENALSFLFIDPIDRIVCRFGDDPQLYLEDLQQHLERGCYLAGWAGYELGAILEGEFEVKTASPYAGGGGVIADFGIFKKPYSFNHNTGVTDFPACSTSVPTLRDYTISNLRSNIDKESYLKALESVHAYIAAGDTYQVNYTLKLLFDFHGSSERLYWDLRRNQSVAYGAYIRNGEERMLSFSPELFFKKNGSQITVRPMKGTAKRGRNEAEERIYSKQLHADIKNRSENVMIVDLLRNDLSRLVHGRGQGTVAVDTLFDVESYESLLQMTSTIRAQIPVEMDHFDLVDIFRALFPCGSITGAPKIRTMQIIDELEKEQRGVYTGAIGYLAPDGNAVFSVPIRTVRLVDDRGEMGIGSGITHGSDPEEEWKESLLKGKFLTHAQPDFTLFETILWQPESGYWLLDSHLSRLKSSALFFKFFYDIEVIEQLLADGQSHFNNDCKRVRLILKKDGRVSLTAISCGPPAATVLPAGHQIQKSDNLPLIDFSDAFIDTDSPWCFHKTTLREIYDREYKGAQQQGVFELLFCNEVGQVTEGCISNIIIYRQGKYFTPPVQCGLLPGVMRERLLSAQSPMLNERILTRDMVTSAEALFVCNSVRGVVQVQLR